MDNTYKTFGNLSDIKIEIKSLCPNNSSAEYFEHLIQNAMEIMKYNNVDITDINHTFYNRELAFLLDGQINSERVSNFILLQTLMDSQIPSDNLLIEDIPKEWTMPRVTRLKY